MLPPPNDTNRPDYARVGEDTATSPAPADSYARHAQACVRQKPRSISLTTLAREIQSGRVLSPSMTTLLSFRAKSRNLSRNGEARMTNVECRRNDEAEIISAEERRYLFSLFRH